MIDIAIERLMPLTVQERYDIINNSLEAANDNGMLSQYVFEHALWCYTAEKLIASVSDEAKKILKENPLLAWDQMLKEETIDSLFEIYNKPLEGNNSEVDTVLEYFAQEAAQYFEEYQNYLLSFGGSLSQIDMLSTNNLDIFTKSLQDFMNSDNTLKTLQVADDWGENNKIKESKSEVTEKELPDNSLFK